MKTNYAPHSNSRPRAPSCIESSSRPHAAGDLGLLASRSARERFAGVTDNVTPFTLRIRKGDCRAVLIVVVMSMDPLDRFGRRHDNN